MNTENKIDYVLLEQVIEGMEDLYDNRDEHTDSEIKKLTEKLNKDEQLELIKHWAIKYHYDDDAENLKPDFLKKTFFLDKLD